MNSFVEGILYSSNPLSLENNNEGILFDGLYVFKEKSGFNGLLNNYSKYKFIFYFSFDLNTTCSFGSIERQIRFVIQDQLELELSFYSLFKNISIVSWITTGAQEYNKNDKIFHSLQYLIDEKYCWNYYKQNNENIKHNPDNFYGYKFRLSNLEVTPGISIIDNFNDLTTDIKFKIDLTNLELLTQINYYNCGLFLENHGFMSDAFNYFNKIIEIEEKKIGNLNLVKTSELKDIVENYLKDNEGEEISLDNFSNTINQLKSKNAKQIRKEIFSKYKLTGDSKIFTNLGSLRGKFSHAGSIDYIHSPDYINGKRFALEILIKKVKI